MLTLPIEIGKKYIRRDGTIITAQSPHSDFVFDLVYVGTHATATAESLMYAWIDSGLIYDGEHTHCNDLIADYVPQVQPLSYDQTDQFDYITYRVVPFMSGNDPMYTLIEEKCKSCGSVVADRRQQMSAAQFDDLRWAVTSVGD